MNRGAVEARMRILLLGAIDMGQVLEAAEAISREQESAHPNSELIRALETAVVVCYWRPFSQSNTIGHLREGDAEDPELHKLMKVERDQVHAHIDVSSGRTADVRDLRPLAGDEGLAFTEDRWGFPDEWLPRIVAVAIRQRDRWRAEATLLKRRLAESE